MTGRTYSFEFFPPKNDAMAETLWASVQRLAPLSPDFVSVTYGAGGSTRERTHATVKRILDETGLKPASHLTCVAAQLMELGAMTARQAPVRWTGFTPSPLLRRGEGWGEVREDSWPLDRFHPSPRPSPR